MQIFYNTEIVFLSKSKKDLIRMYWLFKFMGKPSIVNIGSKILTFAILVRFPIKWILKPTIFKHFCGGETIVECEKTIETLGKSNIGSILDYSAEANHNESDFDLAMNKVLQVIEESKSNKLISFAVFKVTGIARFGLLEKVNNKKELTAVEKLEFEKVQRRMDNICNTAYQSQLPVLIDAEETWIQDAIDMLAIQMMQQYNRMSAIVYNTLQMYRYDRITYLKDIIEKAKKQQYFVGLKLVRGAYMEKERERALAMDYKSPIHSNKEFTDKDFNEAMEICIAHSSIVSICTGSHNEESNALLTKLMYRNGLEKGDKRVHFAQLLGMSDHISYNLSHSGYNVAKYVPFGPIRLVIPYLIRRAQENTSIAGQTGRELNLIKDELKRRKI